jgi:adenylate kinase family enzyme
MTGESPQRPLGRRIAIVGGGGKTTLAAAIAGRASLPHVELDAIYWLPGWHERPANEFADKVFEAIAAAPEGWVTDGNYVSKLGGAVIGQADTVIWLHPPWRVMFWRVFRRTCRRMITRARVCGDNRESFRQTFLSRKSLLWWHIKNRGRYLRDDGQRYRAHMREGATFIALRNSEDIRRLIAAQTAPNPARPRPG